MRSVVVADPDVGATSGTLTLTFSAGKGRQVTVAMTGRSYNRDRFVRQERLLFRSVRTAFGWTCRGGPPGQLWPYLLDARRPRHSEPIRQAG